MATLVEEISEAINVPPRIAMVLVQQLGEMGRRLHINFTAIPPHQLLLLIKTIYERMRKQQETAPNNTKIENAVQQFVFNK